MRIMKEKTYLAYILLGLLYFISKTVYYICGFVYFRGVILGLVATVLTMSIGILSFREYKKANKPVMHWLAALIPLIILPITPIIMLRNLGPEIFQIEKLSILAIFEGLAITQVILAILMFREFKSTCSIHRPN